MQMLDFACKRFEIEDVVKCSLALSKADFRLLKYFIKNGSRRFTTDELAKELFLDKSTVQRGVKKLHGKDLLFRSQINQSKGGYIFLYQIKNKEALRKKILDIVDSWHKRFREEIAKW
jgi:predicted transcriptional regulator